MKSSHSDTCSQLYLNTICTHICSSSYVRSVPDCIIYMDVDGKQHNIKFEIQSDFLYRFVCVTSVNNLYTSNKYNWKLSPIVHIKSFKQRLNDTLLQHLKHKIRDSLKANYYQYFKSLFNVEKYLSFYMTYISRRIFSNLIGSGHF